MLPTDGWIQLCHKCRLPTAHRVVFIPHEFTAYLCRLCAPEGVQYNTHIRFCKQIPCGG